MQLGIAKLKNSVFRLSLHSPLRIFAYYNLYHSISMSDSKYISIKGAKVNNLKNIDVDIPRNKLVVITGLSGSGKSSLAFDTLYALSLIHI